MHETIEAMNDPVAERVFTINEPVYATSLAVYMRSMGTLPMRRRHDRYADGSFGTTYYLELTADQYHDLGGE